MSLDDRLRRGLKSAPDAETELDVADRLEQFYQRAEPRRKRRRMFTTVASSIAVGAVVAIGWSLASFPPRDGDMAAPVGEGFATAEPASEQARRDGIDVWYPIVEEDIEGKQWGIYAVGTGTPCLRREVEGDDGDLVACWMRGFDAHTGLDATHDPAQGASTTVHSFLGFARMDVARVRIVPASGRSVDVPALAVPGASARVYGAVLTGELWSRPVSYELFDVAGRPIPDRDCEPDQYTLRLREEAHGAQGKTVATPSLHIEGLRGIRPCRLSIEASLLIENADGEVFGIRGNGTLAETQGIVTTSTGPLQWEWSNWCGPRNGLRYVARIERTVVGSVPVALPPDCVDAGDPSLLRGLRTEQPRQR